MVNWNSDDLVSLTGSRRPKDSQNVVKSMYTPRKKSCMCKNLWEKTAKRNEQWIWNKLKYIGQVCACVWGCDVEVYVHQEWRRCLWEGCRQLCPARVDAILPEYWCVDRCEALGWLLPQSASRLWTKKACENPCCKKKQWKWMSTHEESSRVFKILVIDKDNTCFIWLLSLSLPIYLFIFLLLTCFCRRPFRSWVCDSPTNQTSLTSGNPCGPVAPPPLSTTTTTTNSQHQQQQLYLCRRPTHHLPCNKKWSEMWSTWEM